MKRTVMLLAAVCAIAAANAQSVGTPSNDSSGMRMQHHWQRQDSTSRQRFKSFRYNRNNDNHFYHGDYGMNRFRQGNNRQHGRFGGFLRWTAEQRKQLQNINADYRKKAADLYRQDDLTLKAYKAGLYALQKDKKERIQALLTTEQKAKIAEHKKRMDENAQVMAAARLEKMKIRLKLSDEQAAAIKMQQQKTRTAIASILKNDNIMHDEKRSRMKEVAKSNRETIRSILTPEQQAALDSLHQHRDGK